jgi:SAM-dependent methyltransferase
VALDLRRFSPSLRLDPSGIWVSSQGAPVSYPADGNLTYFRVEDGSFWFRHRNSLLTTVMRRLPPPGDLLFDVGGGNGFVAQAIQSAGWNVALVEPGPEGAANALRSRGLTNVICARFQDVVFTPSSLPSVGLFDVIEHVEDSRAFLADVRDVLRPGGRLFVTVPAYRWLWSVEDQEAGHFRRYSASSLRKEVEGAGFEVEYWSYFFSMLPPLIFLLRSVPSWLRLRRRATLNQTTAEHAGATSRSRVLARLLEYERRIVDAGKKIRFGSSILLVARRRE